MCFPKGHYYTHVDEAHQVHQSNHSCLRMITASFSLFRSLLIYCICVPLALVLGYLISTPYDRTSFTVVGLVLLFLLVPLFLRWHHAWLIATWNMSVVLFFIPGRPLLWLPLAWVSLL